jgi:hypothetical protein
LLQSSNPVEAREGKALGLVDEVVGKGEAEAGARRLLAQMLAGQRPQRRSLQLDAMEDSATGRRRLQDAAAEVRRKGRFAGPHWAAAVEAVAGALQHRAQPAAGMAAEASAFARCIGSTSASSLMYLFFAKKNAAKVSFAVQSLWLTSSLVQIGSGGGPAPRPLQRFGVVGGGLMGSGIATAALFAGAAVRPCSWPVWRPADMSCVAGGAKGDGAALPRRRRAAHQGCVPSGL